jgi:hypothetical protein
MSIGLILEQAFERPQGRVGINQYQLQNASVGVKVKKGSISTTHSPHHHSIILSTLLGIFLRASPSFFFLYPTPLI